MTVPVPRIEFTADAAVTELSGKLADYDRTKQREELLHPRALVDTTFDAPPRTVEPVAFYTAVGEAILRLRCVQDRTSPLGAQDVLGSPSRVSGETLQRDLRFRDRRTELADGGRVWLLYEYAGRELAEVAVLLGTDLGYVVEAAERATQLLL